MAEEVRYEVHLDGTDKFEHGIDGMKHHANALHETMGELKKTLIEFFAIEKIIEFGKESFEAFTEASKASAQLDASLKSTNDAVGMSRKELDELSESLSKHSLFTKTAETSMESLLTTFTALHEDVFPAASQAINDMSAKMGTDLRTTAIQVGKALQDPIHGITALHRVGVNFSEAQKVMIKRLVETGQAAKAQQIILKELNTEFGGSAQAAANADPMQFMKNQAEELMVKIGGGLSKLFVELRPIIDTVLEAFGKITDVMEGSGMGTVIKEFSGVIGGIVKQLTEIAISIMPSILGFLKPIVKAFEMTFILVQQLIEPLKDVLAPLLDFVVQIVNQLVDEFADLMPILKPIFHIIGEVLGAAIKIALWIDKIIFSFVTWLNHTVIFKAVWDGIVFVLSKVVSFIEKIVGGIKSLLGIKDETIAKTPQEKLAESKDGGLGALGKGGKASNIEPSIQPAQSSAVTGTKQVIINVTIQRMNGIEKLVVESMNKVGNTVGEGLLKALTGATNQWSASTDI